MNLLSLFFGIMKELYYQKQVKYKTDPRIQTSRLLQWQGDKKHTNNNLLENIASLLLLSALHWTFLMMSLLLRQSSFLFWKINMFLAVQIAYTVSVNAIFKSLFLHHFPFVILLITLSSVTHPLVLWEIFSQFKTWLQVLLVTSHSKKRCLQLSYNHSTHIYHQW